MLFVPFAIFLLNSQFVHAQVYDRVFTSQQECMDSVKASISKALQKAPEGGSIRGGCLPIGSGVNSVYKPSTEPTDPCKHTTECKPL